MRGLQEKIIIARQKKAFFRKNREKALKLSLSVCEWRVTKRHPWLCVMAIDVGQVFERNSVEPLLDEIPVHVVNDFFGLFSISAGHIKFRKADDLKAMLPGGGIQNLSGFSVTVRRIGVSG